MDYIKSNKSYWELGYSAPNVDHNVFRFAGRILGPDFNLPQNEERLLDFGCGQGAAVNYFNKLGFNAHGTDFSETDIETASNIWPHHSEKFFLCDGDPSANKYFGDGQQYNVVTAVQSLYYFSKDDFEILIRKLYDQLLDGGVFYATMMGTRSEQFYRNSVATPDPWLREVNFNDGRIDVNGYFMFFIDSEEDLLQRFSMFTPLHVGYYSAKFRSDEGDGFHYTFVGIKS